ncbi:hypothetical protein PF008_g18161 [Phytophthora fragariae]|uniref:Uncharacterized protein n=2 Tax=Phytophthora TaxID=4783 RepID=A0A6G0R655_9STRA|nr:hypothetical protein PF008_g18161 [Phytophthora fragariae]
MPRSIHVCKCFLNSQEVEFTGMAKDGGLNYRGRGNAAKLIDFNLSASRTSPLISNTFDLNLIYLATKVVIFLVVNMAPFALIGVDYAGIKTPQFQFTHLHGADPFLDIEMASTGKVVCLELTCIEP